MPLSRVKGNFLVGLNGVEFLMSDGHREVVCCVEQEVFRYRFGAKNLADDTGAFQTHRQAIEDAASCKYDFTRARFEPPRLLMITMGDFASSLSKKM